MKAIRGCKAEAAIQDIGMVRYAPQCSDLDSNGARAVPLL